MGKYKHVSGEVVEAVEYKEGDEKPKGVDNLAEGTIVITRQDGTTDLVHPNAFSEQYKETK